VLGCAEIRDLPANCTVGLQARAGADAQRRAGHSGGGGSLRQDARWRRSGRCGRERGRSCRRGRGSFRHGQAVGGRRRCPQRDDQPVGPILGKLSRLAEGSRAAGLAGQRQDHAAGRPVQDQIQEYAQGLKGHRDLLPGLPGEEPVVFPIGAGKHLLYGLAGHQQISLDDRRLRRRLAGGCQHGE